MNSGRSHRAFSECSRSKISRVLGRTPLYVAITIKSFMRETFMLARRRVQTRFIVLKLRSASQDTAIKVAARCKTCLNLAHSMLLRVLTLQSCTLPGTVCNASLCRRQGPSPELSPLHYLHLQAQVDLPTASWENAVRGVHQGGIMQ